MGTIKFNANNEVIQTSLFVTNQSTGPLAMAHFSKVGFQLVWDSLYALSTIDASVSISVSNDATHWDEITGLAFDIKTSSGNSCVAVEDVFFAYIKLDVAHNSVTAGSLNVSATYKE